ncbi:MAG: DNA repair protein RecN [Pseudohongiellaceae bacterium]
MLSQLSIRNYAIVDTLDIEFQHGLTAVTGETGAGKSIILGALGLTLGDRSDREMVRSGTDRADITARFETSGLQRAGAWLKEQELDSPDEPDTCILRRSVGADGRSRAWVNGVAVNLQSLKIIGELLIDIHSQHEHQTLLDRQSHARLLDDFGGHHSLTGEVNRIWRDWRQCRQALTDLDRQAEEATAQQELLRYQTSELDELAISEDEPAELDRLCRELGSADEMIADAQQVLNLCSDSEDQSILAALNRALALLQAQKAGARVLAPVGELLGNAQIQVEEAVSELRHRVDNIDRDPERLEEANQRLADIHQLARKHKVPPEELPALHQQLRDQLASGEQNEARREELREHRAELEGHYGKAADRLSTARHEAAETLQERINEQLSELGMPDARLEINFRPNGDGHPQAGGNETTEFLVSTNPGQPARPLIKIASGGELSRISLAIQVITAMTSETPTMVFDEVDVGIGGSVARSVGRLLRRLGERSQVLCVTHQPLVASQAHHHLHVTKQDERGRAVGTHIRTLTDEEKVQEVARMLGGDADQPGFSEESLAHARELMAPAASAG